MAKHLNRSNIVKLPGSRGQEVTVCRCCVHLVNKHKWHVLANGYVARSTWKPRTMIYMHRVIAGAPKGKIVDHINGDTTYNVCWNLRIGTQRENTANAGMWRHNTSGVRGVAWHKQQKCWRAYINVNGHQKSLGLFKTVGEAGVARKAAAKELWGEFAKELQ